MPKQSDDSVDYSVDAFNQVKKSPWVRLIFSAFAVLLFCFLLLILAAHILPFLGISLPFFKWCGSFLTYVSSCLHDSWYVTYFTLVFLPCFVGCAWILKKNSLDKAYKNANLSKILGSVENESPASRDLPQLGLQRASSIAAIGRLLGGDDSGSVSVSFPDADSDLEQDSDDESIDKSVREHEDGGGCDSFDGETDDELEGEIIIESTPEKTEGSPGDVLYAFS